MADCDHAPLAPSSAARLAMCPGSRRLAALFPQEETIESREGTAAHWALAELLNGRDVDVGQVAGNGVTLNEEMIECAELVAEYIAERDGHFVAAAKVEQLVKNPILNIENYGTPDYAVHRPLELFVDDYKHGHKYVEAVGNLQLINYAILIIAEMTTRGDLIDKYLKVTFTIHQPRCYHRGGPHRTWSIMASELEPYRVRLRERYAIAMTDNAPCYATDPTICEHCPGRFGCEAATAAGYSAYEHAFSSVPLVMSSAAQGLELKILRRAAGQLKARISGLEEQVLRGLREPGGVPGWDIEFGSGRLVWDDSTSQDRIISTAAAVGVHIAKQGIMTPTQAKKAGLMPELVAAFTRQQSGAAELVECDATLASRVFGGAS